MKRYALSLFFLIALILGLSFSGKLAQAGSIIFDNGPDTCTTLNCNSVAVNGTYIRESNGNAEPFTIQLFTAGSECVRIDVTSQGTDLEATLTCPTGTTWQVDDAGGTFRPLIKAITPAVRGWCTLTLSHFAGQGSRADFSFRYGRYASNNVNCSGATTPIVFGAEADEGKPLQGGASGPQKAGGTD